jgi:hypothetical protein
MFICAVLWFDLSLLVLSLVSWYISKVPFLKVMVYVFIYAIMGFDLSRMCLVWNLYFDVFSYTF